MSGLWSDCPGKQLLHFFRNFALSRVLYLKQLLFLAPPLEWERKRGRGGLVGVKTL